MNTPDSDSISNKFSTAFQEKKIKNKNKSGGGTKRNALYNIGTSIPFQSPPLNPESINGSDSKEFNNNSL